MIFFHHLHRPGLLHLCEHYVSCGEDTVLAVRDMPTEETHSPKIRLANHVDGDSVVPVSSRSESSWLLEGREQHLDFRRAQLGEVRDIR